MLTISAVNGSNGRVNSLNVDVVGVPSTAARNVRRMLGSITVTGVRWLHDLLIRSFKARALRYLFGADVAFGRMESIQQRHFSQLLHLSCISPHHQPWSFIQRRNGFLAYDPHANLSMLQWSEAWSVFYLASLSH